MSAKFKSENTLTYENLIGFQLELSTTKQNFIESNVSEGHSTKTVGFCLKSLSYFIDWST